MDAEDSDPLQSSPFRFSKGWNDLSFLHPLNFKNSNNDVLSVIAVVAMGSCNETAAAAVAVCIISVDEHWAPLL